MLPIILSIIICLLYKDNAFHHKLFAPKGKNYIFIVKARMTNIRKFTVKILDENGKVTLQTLYLNIDTMQLVSDLSVNGMDIPELDVVCANIC